MALHCSTIGSLIHKLCRVELDAHKGTSITYTTGETLLDALLSSDKIVSVIEDPLICGSSPYEIPYGEVLV